jgi:cobalt-zinc-cadmium efflux system membrane fusion protein
MSPEKRRAAQFHVTPCQTRELRPVRIVPGKITYNEAQHLAIKAPVESVVKLVLVAPEQVVNKGDRLAIVNSPAIGMARDAVAQCKSDLLLAQREADRTEQIGKNLAELLDFLKQHPDAAAIEKRFDDKVLGAHREEVLAAYSKLSLAEAVAENMIVLAGSGSVSGRVIQERRNMRDVAKAAFTTVCEEARFEISQDLEKSGAALQHAQRMLAVNNQRLESLGGDSSDAEDISRGALSELVIRAPFDGRVVERLTTSDARVAAGEPLFVLANTDTLWVSAEVHERDWSLLGGERPHELTLHAPSLPESNTLARVIFTAGKISPETRTLSIVGELDNRQRKFRPGMFVWVSVPMGGPRSVLAVPVSAIVEHEQTRFVFVAEGLDTFRRVDVLTGLETPDWVEIKGGLEAGQNVVEAGTFILKSELLLEHETE